MLVGLGLLDRIQIRSLDIFDQRQLKQLLVGGVADYHRDGFQSRLPGGLQTALARLKGKVRYQPLGFELVPPKFTLTQLQRVYEKILERPLDKRNFRKKLLAMGLLVELDEVEQDVAHRAARLYRFDRKKYLQLEKDGFNFEV